jgi:hypothetical protein
MGFGGRHPYPRRFGGNRHAGNKPLVEVVQESIAAQRGDAFNSDDSTTVVWLENHAYARAVALDGWETNERLALQWDPVRTTDMLERWEAIFKIRPAPDATDKDRRAELLARWQRFGGVANHSKIYTALSAALGDWFVDVEYISLANAVVGVPSPSYPWGTSGPSGTTWWYSTVAHILVKMQSPTGGSEAEFYQQAGKVHLTLDPIVPAWVTYDWYRAPETSAAITVSGGPSAGGWYLDERNIDNSTFDV